jgi:hypothetical protein
MDIKMLIHGGGDGVERQVRPMSGPVARASRLISPK